jgi:hypothetical protein
MQIHQQEYVAADGVGENPQPTDRVARAGVGARVALTVGHQCWVCWWYVCHYRGPGCSGSRTLSTSLSVLPS